MPKTQGQFPREQLIAILTPLVVNSPSPAAIMGDDGSFQIFNRAFCQLLGVQSLNGRTYQEFTHPSDIHGDQSQHLACIAGELEGYKCIKRYVPSGLKTNAPVWAALEVRYYHTSEGDGFAFSQVRDITQEKRNEQQRIARYQLEGAIRNQEFFPWFQPSINAKTGQVEGFEALARRKAPNGRILPPGAFLGEITQCGLVLELNESIYRQAFEELVGWESHLHLSINVYADDKNIERVYRSIADGLLANNLRPDRVVLEILEQSLSSALLIQMYGQLRDEGHDVSLDDLGQGNAVLASLANWPLTRIKLDKTLVDGIGSRKSEAIIRSIITLAGDLGLKVTAEGVETKAQMDWLTRNGVDSLQGYLIARPMPPEEIGAFLEEWEPIAA